MAPQTVITCQFPFLLPITRFEEYGAKVKEWGVYQERLEQFFVETGVSPGDENRKRASLLNSCSKQTYHLLRCLVGPSKPADTSYKVMRNATESLRPSSNSYRKMSLRFCKAAGTGRVFVTLEIV